MPLSSRLARQTIATACLTLAAGAGRAAELLPLWEVGAGAAVLNLPDYRGSDERSARVLPIPYLIYRGEIFQADRHGIRTTLFDNERVVANISLHGSLPVASSDNAARRGMPDLKPVAEVGPTVDFSLWRSANRQVELALRAPLRAAITIESSPRHIGWLFTPNLHLKTQNIAGLSGWNFGMHAGPQFSSSRYNAYLYGVRPSEATPSRPAYRAVSGYAGSQFSLVASKRYQRFWVGTFLRYDTLANASFADSPLVRQHSAVSAGIAVSWVFRESSVRVLADD